MSLSVFMKAANPGRETEEQGFKVYTAAEAAKQADIIMILSMMNYRLNFTKNPSSQTLKKATC